MEAFDRDTPCRWDFFTLPSPQSMMSTCFLEDCGVYTASMVSAIPMFLVFRLNRHLPRHKSHVDCKVVDMRLLGISRPAGVSIRGGT